MKPIKHKEQMEIKEIVKVIENLAGLSFQIEFDTTKVNSTYNPEKMNYEYFKICNQLESHFTELYLESKTLLLEKILVLLFDGLKLWTEIEKSGFYINLNFDNTEFKHLKSELTAEQLIKVAEIKIHYINSLISKIEKLIAVQKIKPVFKISDKLSKVDLIRVLIAMYELKYFEKLNGDRPNKKEIMETFGNFLNTDLTSYSSHFHQALSQPLEVNFQVFEDMKNAIHKIHLNKEN